MPRDLTQVLPLLQRDVAMTIGASYSSLIDDTAADIRELDVADSGEKLVNDVQQYFHDTFVDTTWPACPRHPWHPLWYRDGSWWCVEDGVAVASLGELAETRPAEVQAARSMRSTRVSRHINAPRALVYRALLDREAVAQWRVPNGMTSHVHRFDAREGGAFRVSLTYDEPTAAGKTTPHTDTYHGRFAELVPDARVVEVVEFETSDPTMVGAMTITTTLTDMDGGTQITAIHEGLPAGVSLADNELGYRQAFERLAAFVESSDA